MKKLLIVFISSFIIMGSKCLQNICAAAMHSCEPEQTLVTQDEGLEQSKLASIKDHDDVLDVEKAPKETAELQSYTDDEILLPHKLDLGDTVCVLELSSVFAGGRDIVENRLHEYVTKNLQDRGFKVIVKEDSFTETPTTFGDRETAQLRANLFNEAVKDPEIKAILAFWGGYGATQTLDLIDYDAFRKNRKIFVGFSDETAVELAILKRSRVITFHGPMIGSSLNHKETKTFDNLFDMLMNPKSKIELVNIDDGSSFEAKVDGEAQGIVVGGNLSLIQSLIGTKLDSDWKNKILFFEETEEGKERISRILDHFALAGKFDGLAGIIIGSLSPIEGQTEANLISVCMNHFKDLRIPVICNFHAGHIPNPLTLPIGSKIQISGNRVYVIQRFID